MSTPNSPKVVLVTGAAAGIGKAIAQDLAQAGFRTILCDINKDAGEQTTDEIRQAGGSCEFVECNVCDEDAIEQLIRSIVEKEGRLDAAVNNAGIEGAPLRTADATQDEFDRIMAVNVKGVWMCMKHQIRQMVAQGGGSIVNIASVAGLVGAHSLPIYAASKHAVVGLTKSAALEYARKGIRVNAVCPAVIRTAMFERAMEFNLELGEAVLKGNPSRRLGEPTEVAEAVRWLCSNSSSFTNGATLTVDGGLTAM